MKSIENRNKAFASIVEQLPLKRKQVYNVIKELGRCSLDDIAEHLWVTKNEISGRVTELKETGYIVESDDVKKSTRSNNAVTIYMPVLNNDDRLFLLILNRVYLNNKLESLSIDLTNKALSQITLDLIKIEKKKLSVKFNRVQKEIKKINDINKKSSDIK